MELIFLQGTQVIKQAIPAWRNKFYSNRGRTGHMGAHQRGPSVRVGVREGFREEVKA